MWVSPFTFIEEDIMRYEESVKNRPYVVQVHTADLHIGSIDPAKQFAILDEQFLQPISRIDFDILSIDGDIFDKKFMANSLAIMYAMEFVRRCAELCISKCATFIIISGTESHDAGQLKLFYGYKEDPRLDIRIVESICIEKAQGLRILCVPEEYGKGEEYYREIVSSICDTVFMHGTVVGSVYGANKENLGSSKYPVFALETFSGCTGPIICGHVHKAMCLNGYIYYCSNPIRYRFGEEEEKGFIIMLHDRATSRHCMNFIPIESFRYDTIDIGQLEYNDPNVVITYLDNLLSNGIDNIRIDFSALNEPSIQKIIEQYYANNPNVSIKRYVEKDVPKVNTTNEIASKYSELDFLLDPTMDSYAKFVAFINHNMGSQFITVDKLKSVLSGQ